MLLTQPEADPGELVRDAIEAFLSRNDISGDTIAVSVPGQAGLSKFIKLPPVEASKIPDIVTYEARQQIPFPLEQVIWSWQRLEGGIEESGFVIDAEIALFAMKRDQVAKALEPFKEADIEIDILQLSPVSLANVVMFDQLPKASEADPEAPPSINCFSFFGCRFNRSYCYKWAKNLAANNAYWWQQFHPGTCSGNADDIPKSRELEAQCRTG